ncbi:MAG: serine/threonine protein phosphatase [Clostridiales bacterium]|nr:serine/threonine protein phosphatase [Clostridiales bacterium]
MSIYAIGDLHLSFAPGIDKPMGVYGSRWHDHWERLEANWRRELTDEDTMVVPGDISWGLKLEEAKYDLDWIENLPGKKVFFKGNHDLWWNGITRLNRMYDTITFVQNDFYLAEGLYICGTRGWVTPDNDDYKESDERVYRREMIRLESSLEKAEEHMKAKGESYNILGVLHFPPVSKVGHFSGFQQMFEDHGVKHVIYGHIHGEDGFRNTIVGDFQGINYQLVSLDYLNCKPVLIKE